MENIIKKKRSQFVKYIFGGMGIHQNYNVQSWVVVEPATRPVGTYWFKR